jgi:hypothetical protein
MAIVATLLRLASRVACLIVIVAFAIFAVEQTDKASTHQQNALKGTGSGSSAPQIAEKPSHEGAVHNAIDEAAKALTSPFSSLTSGSGSQWVVRGVGTALALLIYGVAIGYVARMMRIRV